MSEIVPQGIRGNEFKLFIKDILLKGNLKNSKYLDIMLEPKNIKYFDK